MRSMSDRLCPACGEGALTENGIIRECLTVRGEKIQVEAEGCACSSCGQRFRRDMSPWDIAEDVFWQYRRSHGMLQPEEIRSFRLKMDMTQEELAGLLGCSRVTISRYENGALQEASHEALLRAAMDLSGFRKMLGSSSIPDARQRELLARFKEEGISAQESLEALLGNSSPSEFTGFTRPDADKLVAAILYFCRNGISRTKLNKLLFYADFLHFKEFGVSITGAKYAHLPFGPCLDEYQHILAMLIEGRKALGVAEIESSGREGEMIELLKSQIAPDLGVFSPSEMQVIGAVAHQLESLGAEKLSRMSHDEKGWKETANGQLISFEHAADLGLEMTGGR
jgi:putative zinc finger/helix-turn-helix YgiT family protein